MARIQCKACGRAYSYEKEGFCPKCGAYNRPPRKEWVDPDGSIHYMRQHQADTGTVPPHDGKKVCFEQETEHPRKKPSAGWSQVYRTVRQAAASGGVRYSRNGARSLLIAIVAVVAAIVVGNIATSVNDRYTAPPDYIHAEPEPAYPAWELPSDTAIYAELGATFWIDDTVVVVPDCWMRQDEVTYLRLPVLCGGEADSDVEQIFFDARLVWQYDYSDTPEGWLAPAELELSDDDVYYLSYDVFPLMQEDAQGELTLPSDDLISVWLVFTTGQEEIWVTLPLPAEW